MVKKCFAQRIFFVFLHSASCLAAVNADKKKSERVIIRCLVKSKYTLRVSPKTTAGPETFTPTATILPGTPCDGAVKFSYGCFTMPCPLDFHKLKSIEFNA